MHYHAIRQSNRPLEGSNVSVHELCTVESDCSLLQTTAEYGPRKSMRDRFERNMTTNAGYDTQNGSAGVSVSVCTLPNSVSTRGPARSTASSSSGHDEVQNNDQPFGADDAADVKATVEPVLTIATMIDEQLKLEAADTSADHEDDEEQYFQVSIPFYSGGYAPFSYEMALSNRIRNGKLREGGQYSMSKYPPIFIHDCLMVPGALSNVLGEVRRWRRCLWVSCADRQTV
jgi:hypothetical protein